MNGVVIFEGFDLVLLEVASALLPLVAVFIIFQLFFLHLPRERVVQILFGVAITFVGLSLFLQGVNVGFLPTGASIGQQFGQLSNSWIIIPIGIALGFVITIAEPAVRVLNYEVEDVSGGYVPQKVMLYTICVGVSLAIGIAMVKILYGIPLLYIVIPGYLLGLILILRSSPTFISVAFDSGSVATGPLTVTFMMAMTVGIASGIDGRDPLLDGFGMISLVALAPILSVLILGVLFKGGNSDDENEQGPSLDSHDN